MLEESPIVCPSMNVNKEWIDYNGHMNMAYYSLVFDKCVDFVYDDLGIGVDYAKTEGGSCFALEVHVTYLQELVLDDPVKVTFQLLDWDTKRLHFFEQMYHAEDGYLAATSEQIALHVDMGERKSKPLPEAVQTRLDALMGLHEGLAKPPQVGHVIGIRR